MSCFSIAESSCGGYIDKAWFHGGTHIKFAPSTSKEQVEKIKIPVPISEKTLLGHLGQYQSLNNIFVNILLGSAQIMKSLEDKSCFLIFQHFLRNQQTDKSCLIIFDASHDVMGKLIVWWIVSYDNSFEVLVCCSKISQNKWYMPSLWDILLETFAVFLSFWAVELMGMLVQVSYFSVFLW